MRPGPNRTCRLFATRHFDCRVAHGRACVIAAESGGSEPLKAQRYHDQEDLMFTRRTSPLEQRPRPARKRPGRYQRLGALAAICAAAAGFAVVAAAPAQAASGDPRLFFSSTEEAGTFTVTDSNPSLQDSQANRMTVINLQGTPISVYSMKNYTGFCSTYTATTDNQTITINTANGWGPESVGIGINCSQWPGNLYGTSMVIHTTVNVGTCGNPPKPWRLRLGGS
jgi:hypothetical protein